MVRAGFRISASRSRFLINSHEPAVGPRLVVPSAMCEVMRVCLALTWWQRAWPVQIHPTIHWCCAVSCWRWWCGIAFSWLCGLLTSWWCWRRVRASCRPESHLRCCMQCESIRKQCRQHEVSTPWLERARHVCERILVSWGQAALSCSTKSD